MCGRLSPLLHLEVAKPQNTYPGRGGWVAPVIYGLGQHITIGATTKPFQAGPHDPSKTRDLVM